MKPTILTRTQTAIAVVLMSALTYAGCASLNPGADPIAVRAEQADTAAQDAAEFFFSYEDQNEAALEAKFPGFHANVETLRAQYKVRMPQLLQAIDTYKVTRDGGVLVVAIALVNQLLRDISNGIVYANTSGGV